MAAFSEILADVPEASINYVGRVPGGGSFGIPSLAFPGNATDLPAVCAASVNVRSSPDSSYNFGLFLPDTTWNERFLATGNGGFGGGINWPDMGRMTQYGFATMSTDTGHNSTAGDASWALNAPETINDWGHRAMHGSVALAKSVVEAYYGSPGGIRYSYYASCSTGGRQGLREIQLHPDSFDGIAVGAPAWWTTHLAAGTLMMPLNNYPDDDPKHIDGSLFGAIEAEMLRQCDPQDGVVDGIVSDPFGCAFDFEALLCDASSSSSAECLMEEQLETARATYSDLAFDGGEPLFVFPGLPLGTSPGFMLGGFTHYGYGLFRYFVHNDSAWDYTLFARTDVERADEIDPGRAGADDFGSLARFADRGGKILMYHGAADSLISAGSSLFFYDAARKAMASSGGGGAGVDDFFRLFLVPGMEHCSGSAAAPWYIAGGSQALAGTTHSVPGFMDADHDVILAMMKWVEEGSAPEKLVATKFKDDNAAAGVQSQRPLCVYPRQAKYRGTGDVNVPQNWECEDIGR
ncbi:hypothetical protein DL766_000760 [Monosporascus sp. MC13-8B]|uniref:Carboxylic ester hydrolase n=1 Tax=Monosporascus cannonballus TaxID=155416 RepID=A0ABY0HIL6_9PEZI|nr:hypothetical protein DL762_001069 [Monosporascus cannonballus]RYO98844.1 hypothetical protein DL763_001887 [Monosporascus cannonballus]RYP38760.1 hypothetical protein DL766_000760 [Monosporascus sp. MC13-8B]